MTAPGDPSDVGSIIAYLSMRRDDWTRGVRDTERDADRLGRLNPDIRIGTNAAQVAAQLAAVRAAERGIGSDANQAKPFVINLWAALAAIAPAAVPIAGVLSGAMVGAIPLIATVALGLSGINDELKNGQLEGTAYGKDLASLTTELASLKQVSANGILSGLHRGLADSHGLFGEVNADIGTMSGQVGDIVASGMPALLRLLTDLNPLFVTFGTLVTHGAEGLDRWTQNSDGVSKFVTYVQAELPDVIHFFGSLITLLSHLVQAAAPFGGVMLTELTVFFDLLDAIPVDVLKNTIPVVVALYAAFKTYGAITAVVAGVNNAINSMKAPFTSTAAVAVASSTASAGASQTVAQAAADSAVVVARAEAEKAQAVADAAAAMVAPSEGVASLFENEAIAATGAATEITQSWEGVASLFATETDLIAASAAEQALAFQAVADAAILSAEEIAAAAIAAAGTVEAEGEAASIGWAAMLGPLAAVGIGLTFLLTAFTGSTSKAQEAAKVQNSYADSLRKTTDALADVNIKTTNKNLSEDHALANLDALAKGNSGLKLSYHDLTLAVNGSQDQFDKVRDSLMAVAGANKNVIDSGDGYASRGPVPQYNATGQAAVDLLGKIKGLREGLDAQTKTQIALNEANREAQQIQDGGTAAVDATARSLGVTRQAYLDAQVAAKKNTDQTDAQALAFRLANDGGSLLALTLDKLAGKKLNFQQALNSFESQLTTGGPKGTAGTPGTPGTGGKVNAASVALAEEALTVAQDRYNRAVDKGNAAGVESAQLSLDRAKAALAKAKAGSGGTKGTAGTPGTAADTRLTGMSAAAVQNRGDILSLVQTAEQASEAYGKQTGSTEKARQKLVDLRTELINSRVALGENKKDVTKYVDSILTIPPAVAQADKTALDIQTDAAKKKVADFNAHLAALRKGVKVPITVTDPTAMLLTIQKHIDSIHGKQVVIDAISTVAGGGFNVEGGAGKQARAGGGEIFGAGPKGVDSVDVFAAPGEFMMSNAAVDRYGLHFMKSLNAGTLKLPAASPIARAAAPSSSAVAPVAGSRSVHIDKFVQEFHYPEPEQPSRTTSRSMEAAAYVLSDI